MENMISLKDVSAEELAKEITKLLLEKKAQNVKLFDGREKTSVTEFYVNVTGRSGTQVSALADDVAEYTEERDRRPLRIEGRAGNSWLLVDYGDVIVNVFDKPSREFYNFDRHLPEESELDISELVREVDKKFEINNAKE